LLRKADEVAPKLYLGAILGAGVAIGVLLRSWTKKDDHQLSKGEEKKEWEFLYWPNIVGRGEFMRLLFVETSTPYKETYANMSFEEVAKIGYKWGTKFFAFPVIKHGDFVLSQTPVICKYMATRLDNGRLWPKEEHDQYQCEIIMMGVVDFVAEGHDAWHAFDKNVDAIQQKDKEVVILAIAYYKTRRLPKWSAFFEGLLADQLQKYKEKNQITEMKHDAEIYFVGDSLTYVDLCVFHLFHGVQYQCPDEYLSLPIPLVRQFQLRIAHRPKIAQRLFERREKYFGSGPTF